MLVPDQINPQNFIKILYRKNVQLARPFDPGVVLATRTRSILGQRAAQMPLAQRAIWVSQSLI